MYIIYALRNFKNNKRYIGFTGKSIGIRLSEHNRGCNKWARENKPFKLIYQEVCNTKKEAIKIERFL